MTRSEFGTLICAIKTFYPNQGFLPTERAMELWYEALKDVSYRGAVYAVKKWALENKWAPTVADIRDIARRYQEDQNLPPEIRGFMGYKEGGTIGIENMA